MLPLLDEISPDAALIGAVNTVRRAGDWLIGENTDGKGFLRGVREQAGIDPSGKNIVVLGSGGAARAITVNWRSRARRASVFGIAPWNAANLFADI